MKLGIFPCEQCPFVASSGQQLGGHMRSHGGRGNARGRSPRVRWPLKIDADLKRRVERLADHYTVNPSIIAENALIAYLDQHEEVSDWLDDEILAERSTAPWPA